MSKGDIKGVLIAAVGVIVGGLILSYGRDIGILKESHEGFDH